MKAYAVGLTVLATTTLLGAPARAQDTSVATARQLAISGIDAVESGDCDKGAPLLERAEGLHHASVHLQYLARCRKASGRLVAATEMWRRIIREGAPEGSSPAVATALSEAQSELEKALPRLAKKTIRTAQSYPGLALTLDGANLPADMVGAPQVLDPGDHELAVTASGFQSWSQRFSVPEGDDSELVVELTPLEGGATAPGPGETPHDATGSGKSFLGPAGWITGSVGVAALIAGTVTLLSRNSRSDELARKCSPNQTCPMSAFPGQSLEDDKQTIRDLTTATNVLMWGGGALLAGGVTMIVLAGESSRSGSANAAGTALLLGAPRASAGLTLRAHW
jgi:hypothetical protein